MPSTRVTFPEGTLTGEAVVMTVARLADSRVGVVVDQTPFHPVDHAWPDQPADTGTLAGRAVVDCLTGSIGPDGVLLAGDAVTARRGDDGWDWVVVHVLDPAEDAPSIGERVALAVDAERRESLSAGHTACHLAALAMNAEAAGLWRKDPGRPDSLGNPDLDQLAITTSRVMPDAAYDGYRIGKSLRKKGFEAAEFTASLDGLVDRVNGRLAGWLATGAAVRIDTGDDDTLTARRSWVCELPDGEARVPCGGTHVRSLSDLGEVAVAYALADDGQGFDVHTSVRRPG